AGIVSRPMLNWISWKHKYDLGIMITASHNPKEYNGFKFIWNAKPLNYANGLNDIEALMQNVNFADKKSKKSGKIISIDYIDEYVGFLSSHLSKDFRSYIKGHSVKIIADGSNGATGEIIKRFLLQNDVTYELLFTHPDGTFYGHNPNPLDPGATVVLSRKVIEFNSDLGFILDPDGDRIRFVDDKGQVLENEYVDCLVIEQLLKKNRNAAIVHDIISRRILSDTIRRCKGKNIVSRVGTSNIIQSMINEKALFGCEMSGHRYFRIMNNQDSGMMMLVYLLNTVYGKEYAGKRLSSLWKRYDKYVDLGELNYKVSDDKRKVKVIDRILKYYSDNKKKLNVRGVFTLDGVSVVTNVYWFNIRPSNTEPLLRLRIEGKNRNVLLSVKKFLEKMINK
ncbi:MAG: hypothetical protein ACP5OA_05600, partial [Candidatus Woesearchaeota archaeon]